MGNRMQFYLLNRITESSVYSCKLGISLCPKYLCKKYPIATEFMCMSLFVSEMRSNKMKCDLMCESILEEGWDMIDNGSKNHISLKTIVLD